MANSKVTTLRLSGKEIEMLSLALEAFLSTGYQSHIDVREVSFYVQDHRGSLDKLEDRLLRARKRISSCPEQLDTLSQLIGAVDHE